MPDWLVFSLVASLVLTVVANAVIRLLPGLARPPVEDPIGRRTGAAGAQGRRRIQMHVPWRWMIGLSIVGTIVLNLLG